MPEVLCLPVQSEIIKVRAMTNSFGPDYAKMSATIF